MSTTDWTAPATGPWCDWCGSGGGPHAKREQERAQIAGMIGRPPSREYSTARHGYAKTTRNRHSRDIDDSARCSPEEYRVAGSGMARVRGSLE